MVYRFWSVRIQRFTFMRIDNSYWSSTIYTRVIGTTGWPVRHDRRDLEVEEWARHAGEEDSVTDSWFTEQERRTCGAGWSGDIGHGARTGVPRRPNRAGWQHKGEKDVRDEQPVRRSAGGPLGRAARPATRPGTRRAWTAEPRAGAGLHRCPGTGAATPGTARSGGRTTSRTGPGRDERHDCSAGSKY